MCALARHTDDTDAFPKPLCLLCQNPKPRLVLSGPILRDTARLSQRYPPYCGTVGFLVSQHGNLGAIPPPPFLSVSPLESMRSGGAAPPPPPQKGYPSDTCVIPYENKAKACDTPFAMLSRKGIARYGGGISHWGWAAKGSSHHVLVTETEIDYDNPLGPLVPPLESSFF